MQNSSVHNHQRVLVIGTTPDYVQLIRETHPGRAFFVTDPHLRAGAAEPVPDAGEEVLVPMADESQVIQVLRSHLAAHSITPTGVACFDCESLKTAAAIATDLGLDFVSLDAVRNCRDKYLCKKIWQDNQVPCPKIRPVNTLNDALAFFQECRSGIVLKPFYGSGSELVFRCKTSTDCETYFTTIKAELANRQSNPIFKKLSSTEHLMLAEEYVAGPEYSCDLLVDGETISIIRIAKKIKLPTHPFGTVSGYILPAALPSGMDNSAFEALLLKSARSMGISRSICMVDFVIRNQTPHLIELTPRPGGDCLPLLLKTAGNLDIIGMTLDLAEKKEIPVTGISDLPAHVGFRIHASKAGILQGFHSEDLVNEKRIKHLQFIRKPGHSITMPPADYDSWLLGHMIIRPEPQRNLEAQSLLIGQRLKVDIAS